MFAVETKHGQKNSQIKKREKLCVHAKLCSERASFITVLQVASVTEIWSESLTLNCSWFF